MTRLSIRCGSKVTPEQLAVLNRHVEQELKTYPEDYQYEYMRGHLNCGTFRADPSELLREPLLRGLEFSMVVEEIGITAWEALTDRLIAMEKKITRFSCEAEEARVTSPQVNTKVHVHVPNLGLLMIDEVSVQEDLCTKELQNILDEGWRILAICPQPDQRRPDYVLGRAVKENL